MKYVIILVMLLLSGCGTFALDFKMRMGDSDDGEARGKRQTEETIYYRDATLPPATR